MTELGYMIREDWGQDGTAMEQQSAVIRHWFGASPTLYAVENVKTFGSNDRNIDTETARFLEAGGARRRAFPVVDFAQLRASDDRFNDPIVVLHPRSEHALEAIQHAVKLDRLAKVFVMVWSPCDIVRTWLDGLGALNLHSGQALAGPDAAMVEAGREMVNWEYNGLGHDGGKDTVVGLIRAFTAAGYPSDDTTWLRAFFAAGGSMRHSADITRFIREMKSGVQHRVKARYGPDIVDTLRTRTERNAVEN